MKPTVLNFPLTCHLALLSGPLSAQALANLDISYWKLLGGLFRVSQANSLNTFKKDAPLSVRQTVFQSQKFLEFFLAAPVLAPGLEFAREVCPTSSAEASAPTISWAISGTG